MEPPQGSDDTQFVKVQAVVPKFLTDRVGKAGAITALPVGIGLLIFILLFIFILVMAIWGYM